MKNKITLDNEIGNIDSSFSYFEKFNLPKESKILDVGCNYGSLIYNIFLRGYKDVYGIDVSEPSITKGKKNYKQISNSLSAYDGKRIPFEDSTFDIILMFDVIEHIPDIHRFLAEEINRVLKQGGIFIFQTPNKYTNIPWEMYQTRSFTRYKSYHCSLQTLPSLKKLLDKAGFNEIVLEKHTIITDHNIRTLKNKIGFLAMPILYTLQNLPMFLTSNFWGYCKK